MTLKEQYHAAAIACRQAGIPNNSEPDGDIHRWVVQHCSFRPGTAFFIVVGIACEMADLQAQDEGFKDQFDRAWQAVAKKWTRNRFGKWVRKQEDK